MPDKRSYKSVNNLQSEMDQISKDFEIIYQNMIAIGIDYRNKLDPNPDDRRIFEFRDNILYRLNATKLHINILVGLLNNLDEELENIYFRESGTFQMKLHLDSRRSDISSLFDSVIFHIVSTFDYVSNLVGFISMKKYKKVMWPKLAKAVRDQKNELSRVNYSNLVDNIDRAFVGRLYDHRSYLIHTKNDFKKSSLTIDLLKGKVTNKIISSSTFNKNFIELKSLEKNSDLSISFVLIWLLKKTIESIISIQFSLKDFMEQNKKDIDPWIYLKDQKGVFIEGKPSYSRGSVLDK